MKTLVRLVLAGTVVAAPLVGGTPASACGGVDCTVRCVQDLAANGWCRL